MDWTGWMSYVILLTIFAAYENVQDFSAEDEQHLPMFKCIFQQISEMLALLCVLFMRVDIFKVPWSNKIHKYLTVGWQKKILDEPVLHQLDQTIWVLPLQSRGDAAQKINDDIYKNELARLVSFKHFPSQTVFATSLAKAGFYYTGIEDMVCCFSCKLRCKLWKTDDSPVNSHKTLSPHCRFVQTGQAGNIPIDEHEQNNIFAASYPPSVQNTLSTKASTSSYTGDEVPDNSKDKEPKEDTWRETITSIMNNQTYEDLEARRLSFANWPLRYKHIQHPDNLAKAGFVYTGSGDYTCCSFCGLLLHSWRISDSVWTEHADNSPDCPHVTCYKRNKLDLNMNQRDVSEGEESVLLGIDDQCESTTTGMCSSSKALPKSESAFNLFTKHMVSIDDLHRENTRLASLTASLEQDKAELQSMTASLVQDKNGLQNSLDDKTKSLKDQTLCKLCLSREMNIMWSPCRHIMSCNNCSEQLTKCPMCRKPIEEKIVVYIVWNLS